MKLDKLKEYVTIHQHNLQLLMVKICKAENYLNPTVLKTFAERDVQHSLRSKNHLQLPNVKTAEYGIENILRTQAHLLISSRK